MKRLSSSDSLGGLNLISICPNSTDDAVYTKEFQTMLEGLEEEESGGHSSEKKRRLGVDQVKALEKNFEVENKLEPDRKVKLAQELGLQPRQVAVWFQNRRARWKTKQLERDYGALKANYDALMLNFESLKHDNESLLKEIHELKSKLDEEKNDEDDGGAASGKEIKNVMNNNNGGKKSWPKFGDGSSDSDSSAILTEENNSNSPRGRGRGEGSRLVGFELGDGSYEAQMVKIEEHNFFGEESCTTLFSDDQAPTLQQWYCNDQWN